MLMDRFKGSYQKEKKRAFGYSYKSQQEADANARKRWEELYRSQKHEEREVETVHDLAFTLYEPTIANRGVNTYNGYWRDTYVRHIKPSLGELHWSQLTKIVIVSFLNSLPGYNARMKSKIVIKAIVKESIENGVPLRITAESIESINIGKKPAPAELRITSADVKQRMEMCEPHMLLPLYILGAAGLRKGELIALKHSNIDRDEMKLHVASQRLKNGELALPKGGRTRVINITAEFIAMVDRFANQESEWLVTPGGRAPFSHSGFGREWTKLGFDKGVGPHQLRHLVATLLANHAGLVATQKVLGHRHTTTTDRYVHAENIDTSDAIRMSTEELGSVSKWGN